MEMSNKCSSNARSIHDAVAEKWRKTPNKHLFENNLRLNCISFISTAAQNQRTHNFKSHANVLNSCRCLHFSWFVRFRFANFLFQQLYVIVNFVARTHVHAEKIYVFMCDWYHLDMATTKFMNHPLSERKLLCENLNFSLWKLFGNMQLHHLDNICLSKQWSRCPIRMNWLTIFFFASNYFIIIVSLSTIKEMIIVKIYCVRVVCCAVLVSTIGKFANDRNTCEKIPMAK